jgi:hypothetical protein
MSYPFDYERMTRVGRDIKLSTEFFDIFSKPVRGMEVVVAQSVISGAVACVQ